MSKRYSRGDDANLLAALRNGGKHRENSVLIHKSGEELRFSGDPINFLVQLLMQKEAKLWSRSPSRRVLLENRELALAGRGVQFQILTRMTHPGSGAKYDGDFILPRIERTPDEQTDGLQTGKTGPGQGPWPSSQKSGCPVRFESYEGPDRQPPDHESALYPCVGCTHQRIGCHVETHLFHDGGRTSSGKTIGKRDLEGKLSR